MTTTVAANPWQGLPRPFYALAPMEAVTDVVFRHVIKHSASPDLYFTEFTNATGWSHVGEQAVRGRLYKTKDEHPIIAQIWGGEPNDMAKLAVHCKEIGFDGIDINMGCPAKSAIKSGGSALIRQPDLAVRAISAAKTAGLPVSVKTRLGYTRIDEWQDWVRLLLEQDIAALTIHLRTKREMSKVPAHWEVMPEIITLRDRTAPHTLIIGNGDVRDRSHGRELIEQTGCDGVMIGRGVFHNPLAFSEGGVHPKPKQLIELLYYHLDLFDKFQAITQRPFDTLKRFFKIYIRDFEGASALRDTLMHAHSTDEVRQLVADYLKQYPTHDKSAIVTDI